MNMGVQIYLEDSNFTCGGWGQAGLLYISRNAIAGSDGGSIFHVFRSVHTVLP